MDGISLYVYQPVSHFRLFIYLIQSCVLLIKGTLKGFDQTINLIIDDSHERVFSPNQGVEQVQLGLHIIRGDNV